MYTREPMECARDVADPVFAMSALETWRRNSATRRVRRHQIKPSSNVNYALSGGASLAYDVTEWMRLNKEEGRNFAEIGRMFGVTRDTVKNAVHRYRAPQSGVPSSMVEFPDLRKRADPGWAMEFLDVISSVQDTMQSLDTTQTTAHVKVNTDLPIGIVFPGDFHLGGRGTDHHRFKEDVQMWQALGDAVKLVGMGDYSEQFTGSLARIGLHQHVMTVDMQIETVMDLFVNALGPQFIALVKGNHDGWAGAELSNYVMKTAQRCNVPFMGVGGELYLTVGAVEYKLAVWHRYPGASALNKGNNQRRVRIDHNGADVVALAHLHNTFVEFGQTGEINHVGLRCGAYKTTDEHSRDKAGNVIADTRMPMVIVNPREKDILYFEDYRKGVPDLLRLRREWRDYPAFPVTPERLRQLLA